MTQEEKIRAESHDTDSRNLVSSLSERDNPQKWELPLGNVSVCANHPRTASTEVSSNRKANGHTVEKFRPLPRSLQKLPHHFSIVDGVQDDAFASIFDSTATPEQIRSDWWSKAASETSNDKIQEQMRLLKIPLPGARQGGYCRHA
ncbi:hypothetical protein MRX96_021244 [Rhipicephalus microplus]